MRVAPLRLPSLPPGGGDVELAEGLPVRCDEPASQSLPGRFEFRVCRTVPARVGVTPGIQDSGRPALSHAWLVGVPDHDDVRTLLPPEERE